MKSLKEKLLETLYIKESNIDDDLYNASLCIPETEIVFKILCALGFGSENDEQVQEVRNKLQSYVSSTIDVYSI